MATSAPMEHHSYRILPALLGMPYQSPVRQATVHHSVAGTFAIRVKQWKLIEGQGSGDYRPGSFREALRKAEEEGMPRWDPSAGRFTDMLFDIQEPLGDPISYQLYNLDEDPGETTNVADQHPEVLRWLRALLESYRIGNRTAPAR